MTSVTGSNFAGVTQYLSNIQYRAWGALKHVSFGNGTNVDYGYNGRLQITSFGSTSYDYDADGRIRFVHFPSNPSFDRKYSYDHVGRLIEGLSGSDARGETYDPDDPPPYKQTYTYDVWENMSGRTNRYWTLEEDPFSATYVNDRNMAWAYNDSGQVVQNPGGSYVYDSAGRMVKFNDPFLNQSYDGDGLPAKRVEFRPGLNDRATIYYVRSSVLGGQPITELKPDGFKRRTYVYAQGEDIARQEKIAGLPDQVQWIGRDPITGDDDVTRDPLGGYLGNPNDVTFSDYESLKGNATTHDTDADPFDVGSGCTLDGVPIDCSLFASLINNGAVSLQAGGKIIGDFRLGIGGAWVPKEIQTGPPEDLDTAYRDEWVPFALVLGVRYYQDRTGRPVPNAQDVRPDDLAAVYDNCKDTLGSAIPTATWWDARAKKWRSGPYNVIPDLKATAFVVAAADYAFQSSVTTASVIAAEWAFESAGFNLNPIYPDSGPMQLTGLWRSWDVGDAYGSRKNGRPFDGDPLHNLITGGRVLEHIAEVDFGGDIRRAPYGYGPGLRPGQRNKQSVSRSNYEKTIRNLYERYRPFFECVMKARK